MGEESFPPDGTVEELLEQVAALPPPGPEGSVELWVPGRLTLGGDPIGQDIAITVVLDALLAREVVPRDVEERPGGRLYRCGPE